MNAGAVSLTFLALSSFVLATTLGGTAFLNILAADTDDYCKRKNYVVYQGFLVGGAAMFFITSFLVMALLMCCGGGGGESRRRGGCYCC